MARTTVHIQSIPDYTFAQLLTGEQKSLVADEPLGVGGNDLGPDPYDLLLWSLGACTSMTLLMYARRKNYPLHEVAVQVEHDRVHAEDCKHATDDPRSFVETFWRKVVLHGPLSDAQRDDLLRMAQRCPVHKTLTSDPHIVDSVEVVD